MYDLAKLNFGMLEKGSNSDQLVARFNIIEVMDNLYSVKKKLNNAKFNDDEASEAINAALVKSQGSPAN